MDDIFKHYFELVEYEIEHAITIENFDEWFEET